MPSKQRRWQQKMKVEGRCQTCGKPAEHKGYCLEHHEARKAYMVEYRKQ